MKPYTMVDVSEQALEDLVRRHTGLIEDGLVFVDHQNQTKGGRLDVLMVDSGKALVVAELKVVQEDGMLLQGVDYYDYVSSHIEAYARLYKTKNIDPTQPVRLLLIAPSFSQTLVNRCKWVDLPISLFTFNCLKFAEKEDIVAVFTEHLIPTPLETVEVSRLEDHIEYITDPQVRDSVRELLDEIKNWKPNNISLDAVKHSISIKVNGRVFAYYYPRRQHFVLATYNSEGEWRDYQIKDEEDLLNVKPILRTAMERKSNP